ncbi:Uncharacterized membrane protein [Novosphingobium sp. CF614]|uniref:DUF2306 domain-containing protein n=1 Tax=Novosphingobium sp. CF614 TaxID=1884364 RepID=UPI0008DF5E9B|nr:DUF2306 domain-containing protein [Novosphingobium sp. CF614]SFF90988.1 Uncharacterized membrane protein [Novosphingobium sp. CF614]
MTTPYPSTSPDRLEKLLGALALLMLGFVVAAVLRGMDEWPRIPLVIWLHLTTIVTALALTPILLWRRRGTRDHRALGYAWAGSMLLTAIDSLFVRTINPGQFSPIHALSVLTIVLVPSLVLAARSHNVARHRRTVRGLIIGALLIAGFFTFPFERLLGHWLFG